MNHLLQTLGWFATSAALSATPAPAQCSSWTDGFERPGSDNMVRVVTSIHTGADEILYAGGEFTAVGGVQASLIASFDGSVWAPLGTGLEGVNMPSFPGPLVSSIAAFDDGSGSLLFAGGEFDTAGGLPAQNLARWDGTDWSAVASGFTYEPVWHEPSVTALGVFDDGSGAALFVSGDFSTVNGVPAAHLARWDGVSWEPVGGGTNDAVEDMLVFDDGSGPALYVAGSFDVAGGHPVGGIARWDGSSWTSLVGGAVPLNTVALAAFDDGGGTALYATGDFVPFGGGEPTHVARWDGDQWTLSWALEARDIEPYDDGSGTVLYALTNSWGGLQRLTAGGVVSLVGTIEGGSADGMTLSTWAGLLIAGGHFERIEGDVVNHIASWDGSSASAVGDDGDALNGTVHALLSADLGGGPLLYAAGSFDRAGDTLTRRVASWDGTSWSALGPGLSANTGSFAQAKALAVFDHGTGPGLFVGGNFANAGSNGTVLNIARWDGASWSGIGKLTNGIAEANALEVFDDGTGAALYVGGGFGQAAGVPVGRIARYDGASWTALGEGLEKAPQTQVHALAVYDDGGGDALYAAGRFSTAGGLPANLIAKWDGTSWSEVGGGMVGTQINALAVFDDGGGAALFAGGDFTQAGGAPIAHLARWNGSLWSSLTGGDPDGPVHALAVHDEGVGPTLRVGGEFTAVGALGAERVASWRASGWAALESGVDATVRALTVFDDGTATTPSLFAGGDFTVAGDHSSGRLARWSGACTCLLSAYCTAGTSASGCQATLSASGTASASAPSGFTVLASQVEGLKDGLFFFGTNGQQANSWGNGTSFQCVVPPVVRAGLLSGRGSLGLCDGSFAQDLNVLWAAKPAKNPGPGADVNIQLWYRDPQNTSNQTTSLSDALEFTLCP